MPISTCPVSVTLCRKSGAPTPSKPVSSGIGSGMPSVPVGGFPTRALFYQPRFGVAYDITGSGKTVLRGGWGRYYFHSGQFTNGLEAAAGVQQVTVNTGTVGGAHLFAKDLETLNISNAAVSPSAVD